MSLANLRSNTGTDMPFVHPLEGLGRGDLDLAGGKGANLGELVRAGFPVPAGFVVTTDAYQRFVEASGLESAIAEAVWARICDGAPIRAAFERAPIPREVEHRILQAFKALGTEPVAVRSSATAEDLPEAAFAGQQDTYLNVIGEDALLDAVRRCWASLWTDRAIAYRDRQGLDQQAVKLAVVVQRMVQAEAAGVIFTANPVTGARDEMVVDASPGLGEAVVSGLVTPDHVVLKRRRRGVRIAERRLGRREVVVRSLATGGTEHVSAPQVPTRQAVPDRALRRLADLGSSAERVFGFPLDIEWAWAGGDVYLLQARPITALPDPAPRTNGVVRMVAGIFSEILAVRPYPMDVTAWDPALFSAISPMLEELGLGVRPIEELLAEESGVVTGIRGKFPVYPTWRILGAPLRLIRAARRYDAIQWRSDPDLTAALAHAQALEARNVRDLTWEEVLATLHEAIRLPRSLAGEPRRRYFPRAVIATARLRAMLAGLGLSDRFAVLLSGIETKTLETNRALEALADRIRSDETVATAFAANAPDALCSALESSPAGRSFKERFDAFLLEYGHREAVVGTAFEPTWKDAPEVVLALLKGLAQSESRGSTGPIEWEAARDAVLAHPCMKLPALRSSFRRRLAEARCLLQIREDTHFYATMALPIIRRSVLELGRRLVGIGALQAPEGLFHAKLHEVPQAWEPSAQEAAELRAVVDRRQERRASLAERPMVDPRLFKRAEVGADVLVSGMAGSPGVSEGTVCIVREGSEFGKLRPGDVLVAPFTNPAWTPLFQRAAAVVVDSGGPASHAAIVAREYGIPAVMGTVDGTRRLVDGQRVRVDGSNGQVLLSIETSA
ncbi:Phosphoenolpyruvate synthase [compost metagenome]